MIRLFVQGATGRMGTRIRALAEGDDRFEIVALRSRRGPLDAPADDTVTCDVVVDFSVPEASIDAARHARAVHAALLVGTTGLSSGIVRELEDAARFVPVMIAPNTAPGVAVATRLAADAAQALGGAYDVDLVEVHHAGKRDAPSGTALRVAGRLRDDGVPIPDDRIHVLRAGDVVGEHQVIFSGPGEQITITHRATTRDVFAHGALRAAAWLHGRPPGLYTIEDALGAAEVRDASHAGKEPGAS